MRGCNSFFILLALLFLVSVNALAFDDAVTHPVITDAAINLRTSKLAKYIEENLGYAEGIELGVQGIAPIDFDSNGKKINKGDQTTLSVLSWLKLGSTAEDSMHDCRAANHFHNPLQPWAQSGSSDPGSIFQQSCSPLYSAVTWATGFRSKTEPQLFDDPAFTANPDRAPNNWNNARLPQLAHLRR